uniref:Uncharacterized protein n=1 Tax=Physcomitrium patens TaxID=3218 RepID=A0A2K1IWZ7_PHYPA|nr:hypothetical protein PHYPA_023619 [Physcomitrium patens]
MFKIVNAAINPWGTLLGIPRETNMPPPNIPWAPLGEACPLNVLTVVNEILAITCCREDEGTENEESLEIWHFGRRTESPLLTATHSSDIKPQWQIRESLPVLGGNEFHPVVPTANTKNRKAKEVFVAYGDCTCIHQFEL